MNGTHLPDTLYFAKAEEDMDMFPSYHMVGKDELFDFLESALADCHKRLSRISENEYWESTS